MLVGPDHPLSNSVLVRENAHQASRDVARRVVKNLGTQPNAYLAVGSPISLRKVLEVSALVPIVPASIAPKAPLLEEEAQDVYRQAVPAVARASLVELLAGRPELVAREPAFVSGEFERSIGILHIPRRPRPAVDVDLGDAQTVGSPIDLGRTEQPLQLFPQVVRGGLKFGIRGDLQLVPDPWADDATLADERL